MSNGNGASMLEFWILGILSDGERPKSEIQHRLTESGGPTSATQLQVALESLKRKKLIAVRGNGQESFSLTAEGRQEHRRGREVTLHTGAVRASFA